MIAALDLQKINSSAYANLATEEDLRVLFDWYTQYFADDEATEPVIGPVSELVFDLKEAKTGDLGIDMECKLSPDALALNLGFRNQLPVQFNTRRHKSGSTAWETVLDDKNSLPLKLHWHQLSGVHSIIRRAFTSEPDPAHCTATLECDEVGLGKTTLAITVMAFLNQVATLQEKGQDLPSILGVFA